MASHAPCCGSSLLSHVTELRHAQVHVTSAGPHLDVRQHPHSRGGEIQRLPCARVGKCPAPMLSLDLSHAAAAWPTSTEEPVLTGRRTFLPEEGRWAGPARGWREKGTPPRVAQSNTRVKGSHGLAAIPAPWAPSARWRLIIKASSSEDRTQHHARERCHIPTRALARIGSGDKTACGILISALPFFILPNTSRANADRQRADQRAPAARANEL